MSNKRNVLVGGGVAAVCLLVAVLALVQNQASSTRFAELAKAKADERLQVYGKLDPGSIEPLKGATTVRFDLVEEQTGERLQVVYDNPAIALPATFPAALHAQAKGTYVAADKRFIADTVLTKCPTKYDQNQLELDAVRKAAVDRWQKGTGLRADAS